MIDAQRLAAFEFAHSMYQRSMSQHGKQNEIWYRIMALDYTWAHWTMYQWSPTPGYVSD